MVLKENIDVIGKNLQALRKERGLSLEKVSVLTDVSKGMLAQIERGDSIPTVTTLWKIAKGLKVSFSSLITQQQKSIKVIRNQDIQTVTEEDGKYRVHNIVPFSPEKLFELYVVEIDGDTEHYAEAHTVGVEEHIFVNKGEFQMDVNGNLTKLNEGEAIIFDGSQPHTYINSSDEVVKLTMIMYYNN